jgi:glycosyltransferase involved in cell wall biosynthesis
MTQPTIGIGIPTYNRADYLRESLESLLAQTVRDVIFIVVDDCSTDTTAAIVQHYAGLDGRIIFSRNGQRVGMIENWRRAYMLARLHIPNMRYFGWGSDHDVWHPMWLDALVSELDMQAGAVLAYPQSVRISEAGDVMRQPWRFSTVDIANPLDRFRVTVRRQSAGNMIYGLFRAEALERAGVFPHVLAPDRLLLSQLALYGQFLQTDGVLWYRRFSLTVTNARQRRAFYPARAPISSYLPWSLTHGAVLLRRLVIEGAARPEVGRLNGLRLTAFYVGRSSVAIVRSTARRRVRRVPKPLRRLVPRSVKMVRRAAEGALRRRTRRQDRRAARNARTS